jgi:hypothetical protein
VELRAHGDPGRHFLLLLWALHKNGKTARASVCEIEGFDIELSYYRDSELMQSMIFRDGTELLKEAQIKRFDPEERGWQLEGQR